MYSSSVGSVLFLCLVLNSANDMNKTKEICSFLKPNGKYEGIGLFKRYSKGRTPDSVPHLMYNKRGQELNFELNEDHTLITMTEKGITSNDDRIAMFGVYFQIEWLLLWKPIYWANCFVSKEHEKFIQCQDLNNNHGETVIHESRLQSIIFRAHSPKETKQMDSYYTIVRSKSSKEKVYFKSIAKWDSKLSVYLKYEFERTCSEDCPDTQFLDWMNESYVSRLDAVLDINTRNERVAGYLLVFNIDDSPRFCYQSAGEELSDNCRYSENLIPLFEPCFNESSKQKIYSESKEISDRTIDPLVWVFLVEVILGAILVYLILRMIDIRRKRWEQQTSEETNTPNSSTT